MAICSPKFTAAAVVALVAPAAFAAAPLFDRVSDSIVQIGIIDKARRLVLHPEGRFAIVDQRTGARHQLDERDYTVASRDNRLFVGPFQFAGQARLLPQTSDDLVLLGKKKYHGNLLVRPNGDSTVTIISELGLEEYLYGVVAAELGPNWPIEALKAQAVVARTFALANLGKFQASGYDFSGDERSQLYADLDNHDAAAIEAVQATQGQVLYWKGKILKAFFHSCCGGHTSNLGAIWGSSETQDPPLRGVSDRYCSSSPYYRWSAYFSTADILDALNRHQIPAVPGDNWNARDRGESSSPLPAVSLRAIRIGRQDRSGFVKTLIFHVNRTKVEVRAYDFRAWMGAADMRSTKLLRIRKGRQGFQFDGAGFGHGVGLCQWGARALAERGKNYQQILRYYFPGAQLVEREE